jgi:uncharacterized membrane protein YoaK (UPF0700 family)
MKNVLLEIWRTLVPHPDDKDGPLRSMLIALTVVSGMVDSFSFLELGHLFVANVTGDVLFIAFGLAGAHGFSIYASLTALAAFFVGAFVGGRLFVRCGAHRGRLLSIVCLIEAVLFAASMVLATTTNDPARDGYRYAFIVMLALAMGLQNAIALKLSVPGLTTSVLTMAITGISADSHLAGGSGSHLGARTTSALSLFLGALIGAALILRVTIWSDLLAATVILAAVGVIAAVLSKSNPPWVKPA